MVINNFFSVYFENVPFSTFLSKNDLHDLLCIMGNQYDGAHVRYCSSLVFLLDSLVFFLHFLLAKGLDKHSLHTIIPRTF